MKLGWDENALIVQRLFKFEWVIFEIGLYGRDEARLENQSDFHAVDL